VKGLNVFAGKGVKQAMKQQLAAFRFFVAVPMSAACLLAQGTTVPSASKGPGPEVRPPVSKADIEIVKRARKILDSPSKWNRADNRICPAGAKTFSLYCALEKATDEVSGNFQHRGAAMQEARFVIDEIAPNRDNYQHRLMGYNNDPTTTFADLQKVFRLMEGRIAKRLKEGPATVEMPAAQPVAMAAPQDAPPVAPPVNQADLQVVEKVREILNSESKWSRVDTQQCPADAKTVTLLCAFRMAAKQVSGASSAAIDEARLTISETTPNRASYSARLTDYNNDKTVTFADLQKFLQLVEKRLAKRLADEQAGK
jgi:hypothetical protein